MIGAIVKVLNLKQNISVFLSSKTNGVHLLIYLDCLQEEPEHVHS